MKPSYEHFEYNDRRYRVTMPATNVPHVDANRVLLAHVQTELIPGFWMPLIDEACTVLFQPVADTKDLLAVLSLAAFALFRKQTATAA